MKIGFIGLGIMGAPMAGHLIKGGHEVWLSDIKPVPPALIEAGGKAAKSAKEAAEKSDVIITMVPDTPHVESALFGELGGESLEGQDRRRHEPIHHCTKEFAKHQPARLRVPGYAGVGAVRATRRASIGRGAGAPLEVKPLFQLLGKNITLVGSNGDGQTTKVANQIIVGGTIAIVAEALLFASKAGADPAKVRQALMGGFANSRILEVHGERMVKRTFDPGFRIELHLKDLSLALTGARTLQMSLPLTAITQQLMNACAARGGGGWDHSAG
jgi:2-hydroxy-3-oxopropionate reductase